MSRKDETVLGEHFWPAMYPGVIIGLLVGLAGGTFKSAALGALGGLLGAMALHFVLGWIGIEEDFLSLAGLIVGAAAGAYVFVQAGNRVLRAD